MTRLNWKLVSVRVEIVLILMQDSCAVCDKRTIGSEIILVYFETVFVSVSYRCTVCAERTIGSKIGLDTANGTPR